MRVLVTGGSGHIGSAVIPELLEAGHQVVGLARSDSAAATLEARGAAVVRGQLSDPDSLRAAATGVDGVIHLAFDHEAMMAGDIAGAAGTDLAAARALADGLAATDGAPGGDGAAAGSGATAEGRPFVGTSGTLMLALGGLARLGTEHDTFANGYRTDTENFVIGLAERGIRSSVLRLPPVVHSSLDKHGFIAMLIATARQHGAAGYVGDGANRWPAGHTLDVARLYRLALEAAPAGTRLHAVDDEGVALREIAATIAARLGLPTTSVAPEDVAAHFGPLAMVIALDNPTSSTITRRLLDWTPTHAKLLADLEAGHYFEAA